MNTAFDQNEPEFCVLILSVTIEMLTHINSLLDKHIQIFRDFWSQSSCFQDAKNLIIGDCMDLSNTLRITQIHTDLGWNETFLCQLANLIDNLIGRGLQPGRRVTLIRQRCLGNTLSVGRKKELKQPMTPRARFPVSTAARHRGERRKEIKKTTTTHSR